MSSTVFAPQSRYKNFVVNRVLEIPELQITVTELIHEPTGAEVMHLKADDDENLFNLSFRTWPETSNGVAHILEHTVLCGSDKFPIKDPFFEMGRRSLNTFMNALTGADFTCYPASSQVPKDFYNLLEVYLDAVFHPKLLKESFLQEGHRLEFFEPEKSSSPLIYKGIVFNEMKGALASADARMGEVLMQALFPDITYGVNSGGDPRVIPTLTYDQLKTFHKIYYAPSRCLFFFYGNLPLEGHLDFLEEHAFKNAIKQSPLPSLPKQPRFKEKVYKEATYPMAENEDDKEKTLVGMGWLTCPILNQEDVLALNVIDLALMGTDATPLKLALLKSGLCKQADSTVENEMSEVPVTLVCRGCPQDAAPALEKLVEETLQKIVEEGLPKHLVDGSIHQLEMGRSEITGNSSPYGLSLYFRSALLKQHGGNVEDGLQIHTLFKKLREKVEDPKYLPNLIQKYLLDNPHFVCIVMHPDKALAAKEVFEEQENLRLIQASLSDHSKDLIVKQAKDLLKYQEEEEHQNVDVLPKVHLSDVPHKGKEFPLREEQQGSLKVFHYPCFTNEILYTDVIFDLPKTTEEDLPLLRLFTLFLTQVGCGGRDYKTHLDYLLQHTGGIGASLDLSLQVENPDNMRPMLSLKGKALHRKADKLFPLMQDILLSADFTDRARIKELLMQHYYSLENSIQNSPLRYAVNLAGSGLAVHSHIINAWYGLKYYSRIKELIVDFEKNPNALIDKFNELKERCLALEGAHLVMTCDEPFYEELKKHEFYGLSHLPQKKFQHWKNEYSLQAVPSQGRLTSSPVAFTAMMFPSIPYIHPDAAPLSIVSEIMENVTLHKRIREQGGAYGSAAVYAAMSGQFYFYSYRDPHIASTLKAFKESVEDIAKGNFEEADIEEAKLGIIQDLDSPCAPGSRGITGYVRLRSGRTPETRQEFRERLLAADFSTIKKAARNHVVEPMKDAVLVTFAGKELLEKENEKLKEKLPLFPI